MPASPPSLDSTIGGEVSSSVPASAATLRHRAPGPPRGLPYVLVSLALLASGTAAAVYLKALRAPLTIRGLRLVDEDLSEVPAAALPARVHAAAERFLDRPVRLFAGGERTRARLRDLGLVVDEAQAARAALAVGHSGDPLADLQARWQGRRHGVSVPLPVSVERTRALDYLGELKDRVDRSPVDAHLDLEHHRIAPEQPGYLLRVYDSLVALEYAARGLSYGRAVTDIDMAVAETQPRIRSADLRDIDVSTVLGSWETRYSSTGVDSDRAYNLKVGADKLNGHILRPGDLFSFNETVGNRTEKEGYRVAPVIQGGELVDGLAGGMCQIASTLHAAAFFAGLELVRATPHSRPSAYIPMGLDSTVVWPAVDLKLKNPYDFPIVIHYMVNQGSVKVELLGKTRPYSVAYEREILQESGFGTEVRRDPTLRGGQRLVEQEGYPGYHIKRRRYLFTGKWKLDPKNDNRPRPENLVGKKEWDLYYPSTTQIVRLGTGPTSLTPREPPPAHHIPAVPPKDKPFYYIVK